MVLPSWTYPLRGILYFTTHPRLWLTVFCGILLALAFSITSTVLLFVFALRPQAEGLASTALPEWLAWIMAVILVLVEIFASSILFVAIALPVLADELFDLVFVAAGVPAGEGSCARGCWMGLAHAGVWVAYLVFARLAILIITAPLHLLPVVGTVLFLFINGYFAAWNQHLHWFDLRDCGFSSGKQFVRNNRGAYASCGAIMVLLEMIPGIGILFMFTNIVGAALWAIDLEQGGVHLGSAGEQRIHI